MPDRETVITHLQIIHTWAKFARERDLQFFTAKHLEDIATWTKDAFSMLKEQESVKPSTSHHLFICPVCKTILKRAQKFCHECGKRIEWKGRLS